MRTHARHRRCRAFYLVCQLLCVTALIGATLSGCLPHNTAASPNSTTPENLKPQAQTDATLLIACHPQPCRQIEYAPGEDQAISSLFVSDTIDLTGDGVPERINHVDTTVIVSEGTVEVWRSPEIWRIVDVALGDPNDDGRGEMLLAFWRDDAAGIPQSHPFIVGYREGRYQELWGGSPVAHPIYEVELGDVDGDGIAELIVLEAHGKAERAVTVWRWHGWGFSLLWRSAVGAYHDLRLLYNEDNQPPTIAVSLRTER